MMEKVDYRKAYQKKVRFVRAELYRFRPLKLPREFWDSTGGPFDTVPVDAWLDFVQPKRYGRAVSLLGKDEAVFEAHYRKWRKKL